MSNLVFQNRVPPTRGNKLMGANIKYRILIPYAAHMRGTSMWVSHLMCTLPTISHAERFVAVNFSFSGIFPGVDRTFTFLSTQLYFNSINKTSPITGRMLFHLFQRSTYQHPSGRYLATKASMPPMALWLSGSSSHGESGGPKSTVIL